MILMPISLQDESTDSQKGVDIDLVVMLPLRVYATSLPYFDGTVSP